MISSADILQDLRRRPGGAHLLEEPSACDGIPSCFVPADDVHALLQSLHADLPRHRMLYDLTAIDERARQHREGQPPASFSVVYHLLDFDTGSFLRLKVALSGEHPHLSTITDVWPSANWYERETWDMFGIIFDGHPHLRRILMPDGWVGHPLRKNHPARATEMGPFQLTPQKEEAEQEALRFRPEDWGLHRHSGDEEFLFLNVGPQHPGTHGVLRVVLQLDGEEIVDAVPDIGFHHRGAEKMGERQSWHTYIPYTDRVDYLSGVLNNFAYLNAVERLAGIEVPPRAQTIRVLMAELFRIISHLVWYGTFAQDLGQMSPVFYTFNDRERAFALVEAVTGARMHPSWFRIGGVAADLPRGWEKLFREFIDYLPARLDAYDHTVLDNRIFRGRTIDVGGMTVDEALEWGVTGPNLRACGLRWDVRRMQPYSIYPQLEFDVPTAVGGDCYARACVRVEEMRQSLRIMRQCLDNMPAGEYQSAHPLATPPRKEQTMHDIETLITHFLNVSWGPVLPVGEALGFIEGSKGHYGYYLVSDGNTVSYRTRIRTPSFAHMQILPRLVRGRMVSDLLAVLGSLDYVLSDVDR